MVVGSQHLVNGTCTERHEDMTLSMDVRRFNWQNGTAVLHSDNLALVVCNQVLTFSPIWNGNPQLYINFLFFFSSLSFQVSSTTDEVSE